MGLRLLIGLFLIFILTSVAYAGCGLDACPAITPTTQVFGPSDTLLGNFSLGSEFKSTAFDHDGISGAYYRFTPRIEYTGIKKLTVGAYMPIVSLRASAITEDGQGNPVLFADYQVLTVRNIALHSGLQYELPAGENAGSIASKHAELLPYFGAKASFRDAYLFGTVGYRVALSAAPDHHDEEEEHEQHGLLVDPHEDQEFVYRVGVGRHFDGFSIEGFLDGQRILSGSATTRHFMYAGLAVPVEISERIQFRTTIELPLTMPQRRGFSVGFGVMADFE